MKKKLCFLFILMFSPGLYSQEKDISALLEAIDNGNIESAEAGLRKLKSTNPNDPSVIYLDAVLTTNGKQALSKYEKVVESYPGSRYADASLYRIYSYYYAQGLYNTAQKYYDKLKDDYPSSAYLKPLKNNIIKDTSGPEVNTAVSDNQEDHTNITISESEKEKSEPVKVYRYTIQTGAFLVQNNALNLKETFQKAGYFSEIKEKKVGGSTFSIVFIGRFETEEEAKTFLTDLNKRQKIEGRIVHIE